MRNFNPFITAVLCCIYRPVASAVTANCDAALISSAGIPTTGTPLVDKIQAGTNITLNVGAGCDQSTVASVDMCRVAMNVTTSSRSSIYVELWLPDNWKRRYASTGNFGLAGCILYGDLQYLSSLNVAVGGANGGYFGGSEAPFSNPDVITDYSFRSVHNLTSIAKQLTTTYYNLAPKKSYFYGCSTGGRQGLQSAQMFPEDFDGIIASSAAADFNGLTGWSGLPFTTIGVSGSPTFISEAQWNAIGEAVMNQCDIIDGVQDGIIEDPDLCSFDLTTFLCGTGSNSQSNCLTRDQLHAAKTVLGPVRDFSNRLLYPAMQPGVEAAAFQSNYNGQPNPIPTTWFQTAIFPGQNYDPSKLNISGVIFGETLDLSSISTFNGDLTTFKNNGGKLITLHGLADQIITSANSRRYYQHVSATMNLSPNELDDFYRYFRISGMGHCSSGSGASALGLSGTHAVPNDGQHNVVLALFDWVENGNAPDTLLGTKFQNDADPNSQIAFSRNHCRYPFRTTYIGGDPNLPGSWNCKAITSTNGPLPEET